MDDFDLALQKVELSDTLNITEVCRTCLSKTPDLKDLFTEFSYIPEFIASFTAVRITYQDQFSQLICMKCVDQITQIYNFRRQIEEVDVRLRNFIVEESSMIDPSLDLTGLIEGDMQEIEETINEMNNDSELMAFIDVDPEPRGKFKCQICGDCFANSSQLKTHRDGSEKCSLLKQDEAQSELWKCTECQEGFDNKEDYALHVSVHQVTDICVCVKCQKVCPNLKSLKRHIKTHYQTRPFKCKVCHLGFSETASLTRHYKKHLGIVTDAQLECRDCGQKFKEKYALTVHVRKHTGETPFMCPDCGKGFNDKRLLKSHALIHAPQKLYKCDLCSVNFTHRSTLITHMRVHTNDRPFVCRHCSAKFKQSTHLKIHMRSHTNDRPYACKLCNYKAASTSSLKTHQNTHTGVKKHKCKICNELFASRDLRAHHATHSGEKNYLCGLVGCMKTFATQGMLNTHMKQRHPTPFVCTECGQIFMSKTTLLKHSETHEQFLNLDDYQNEIYMESTT